MPRNIALVGCGAIARQFHLAALARRRQDFDKVWVIDPSEQARQIACSIVNAEHGLALSDIEDDLEFVIVATPNANHFSAAREALSRGAHVLIEKPFVIWPDEGRELVKLAAEHRRVVAVNHTRRFFPHAQELRKRISASEFGTLTGIVHNEGVKNIWPYSSGASFAPGAQRTGVIMDIGVHILDFYQYLLEPIWAYESAVHDGFKGPEGLAEIRLKANDALVSIRLSRYQKQENIAYLEFEGARVQINIFEPNAYFIIRKVSGKDRRIFVESPSIDPSSLPHEVLNDFIAAAMGQGQARCEAASSLPVINLLDEIYRCAERYPQIPGAV